jgi:UDP-N-acetyl-D-mannosaminuronate dehydrogenase
MQNIILILRFGVTFKEDYHDIKNGKVVDAIQGIIKKTNWSL